MGPLKTHLYKSGCEWHLRSELSADKSKPQDLLVETVQLSVKKSTFLWLKWKIGHE